MDRSVIEQQLRQLPKEAAVAFAARVALRMLPFLADSKSNRGRKSVFGYWGEDKKSGNLLAVLMACKLSVLGALGRKHFQLTNVANAAAKAAAYAAVYTAANAAAAADADADAAADAAAASAYAVAYAAANANANANASVHYIIEELENDLLLLS